MKKSRDVEIYGEVLRIEAKKGRGHRCDRDCKASGHRYFHDSEGKYKTRIVGLDSGDVLLTTRKKKR